MPADYDSTARALALPVEPNRTSPDQRSLSPAWTRRSQSYRRGQSPYSDGAPTLKDRILRSAEKLQRQTLKTYNRLSPLQRISIAVTFAMTTTLGVLFLAYNERIFSWLAPLAQKWRNVRGGWLIIWALTFLVSFPPLIGYSSCVTIAGFVYGFPNGWFIVASATILGSTASFLVSRTLMKNFVTRLTAHDKRFAALSLTLKHDGIKLLCMIRLCPLPYSLSNGAIATFPTVHWLSFMLATAIASPKLLLHVFVGSRLGAIAKSGDKMDAKTKAISYLSIVIGLIAGVATGWIMYRKTTARAQELEAEEAETTRRSSSDEVEAEYSDDSEEREAVAALRNSGDDISLHRNETDNNAYADTFSEDEDVQDVFELGDGDEEEGFASKGPRK
ncbi:hypothetical protein LTR04_004650 [Oleoguttula sp. CCFEE 6159]|nr:hypothetical protein LTR04_004650 [Oleoguttula sp. CCFEE 6159]